VETFKRWWPTYLILLALVLLGVALLFRHPLYQDMAYLGLVVVTAIYVFATHRISNATSKQTTETRRMIDEMRQSRLDAARPSLSLQPVNITLGGIFSSLYLRNSGGVARDVKIDIEVTTTEQKQAIFVPAIDRDHMVYLPISGIDSLYIAGGLMSMHIDFEDSHNQSLTEDLSIDFSKLKEEGRELTGQYSELNELKRVLENIERSVKNIERKIWSA